MADRLHRGASSNDSSDALQRNQKARTAHEGSIVELRQSEELNQQILDSSYDCIKVLDLEGRILFMSRGGQALLGIQEITPFLNTSWVKFWPESEQQAAIEAIARARAGEVCTVQGYCPTLSGEPKWWDNKISPIRGVDGQVERLLCISRDITDRVRAENERQQAEEALRAAQESLNIAVEAAQMGTWYLDLTKNSSSKRSVRHDRIFGYDTPQTEWGQEIAKRHVVEEDREIFDAAFARAMETGELAFEVRIQRSDGSIHWIACRGRFYFDSSGKPIYGGGVNFDITAAKHLEEDRKRREANTAFLADITNDLSRLSTADEIVQTVGAKIGAYLEITTCNFTDVDEARGEVTVYYGWNSADVPSTVGRFRITDYLSKEFERASRAGETLVIRDTQTDPRTDARGYAALNMYSFVTVPFHRNGRWTHYIAVCDSRPRDWREDEIELIEELSNRIFSRLERASAEAALRQSEQSFRLMADAVPQIVWITDAQGRVEFFNKQWSNYTGVAYEATTAAEVAANFVHPDDGDRTMEAFNEARRSGGVFSVEHRIRSAAGTYRWFLVRAEPYRDPQTGEIVRWFGASVDIHDRKRMEANFAFLAEIMADFAPLKTADEIMQMTCARTAAYFDLSRCLLVKVNDAMDKAEVVYDFSTNDLPSLVGTYRIADFHSQDEVQQLASGGAIVVNDVAAIPRTAEAANRFTQLQIGALVNASYVSDGQWKFVLSAIQTKPRIWCADEIELLQELSARVWLRIERAHAEVALRESEAKYRSLFESMDEGFCILQLIFDEEQKPIDYRYIEINPAFERQTGMKNALGRTVRELVPNIEPFWFDIYGKVALTGEATRFVDRAESMGRWFDVNAFRIGDPHERKVAVLFNDISDRKRAEAEREQLLANEQQARVAAEASREEAQAANRVKDEFLAVLSHELRSPLNPILGWSTLLQNRKLNENQTAQALATIQRNAKLQSELIEDLLDVSRILRGKLSLNVAPVNLASIVRAAMETVQLAAEAKSIAIKASFEPDVGLVLGDSTRLQQVIWNLLSNAVKFTPTGGQVNIWLERLDSCARITIGDTGQGISPDFLPYVFDYFRQADATTTRKFGGLGLGLAIVRHLVELHGGTVGAESPGVGMGATFTVRLPLRPLQATAHQNGQSSERSSDLNGIQVLVVDDESDSRDFVAFVLEQAGAKVITATTADEALTMLRRSKPDVLLSDIGMPQMDGYKLMQQVRELPPEQGGQIPAIALTAYAGDFDRQQALKAGFQQHISKPVEPERLVRAIASLLNLLQSRLG